MTMNPPHRRRPKFTSPASRPNDTAVAAGAAIGAALAAHRRGTFRLSPFLPGAYLHVDLDDPMLYPDVHAVMRDVVVLFGVLTECALTERRQRLAEAPSPGFTFGPLAVPYEPAFTMISAVSDAIARTANNPFSGLIDTVRAEHNRHVLRDLAMQTASMHAALLTHCTDASDVPAEFAAARLDELEALLNA